MPGILPMKVIKVGTSSQSRIAQACDRCRSKKIRCDGIRPCCSQCANVGFECRTSDKLSRRAFPRGYTESLEERVRQLEAEVRELKDLLDEKDEKIDMLSRLYGRRPAASSHAHSPASEHHGSPAPQAKEDTFRIQASPLLLGVENSDSYFMGGSSGRSFIGAHPYFPHAPLSDISIGFASCLEFIYLHSLICRICKTKGSREWKVMSRVQSRGVLAHPGLLSPVF